jgi:RND family efflux transporter MFP subunit
MLWFLVGLTTTARAQANKKDAPSPVTLVEVTRKNLRQEVQLSGSSIPWQRVLLSPRVEGLATRMFVDVGAWVKRGDPVLELDTRLADIEIDVAQARVAAAEAKQRDALRKRDELVRLKKNRHASETAIESAIADLEIATADLTRERAELERARELRERHRVFAPFAGMVVSKQVEVGQWVKQDDTVVELVEMDTLRVQAPLSQRYYPLVTVGAKARVKFDALPDREFSGKVFARVALGNEASRSFPLLIDIANPEHLLAPGMSARVRVELENGSIDAVTVPRDAVVAKSSGERVVWRVRDEQGQLKVFPVSIETGRAQGDLLEVVSGELKVGDRVVMLGNERLRPGQTVSDRTAGPTVANE